MRGFFILNPNLHYFVRVVVYCGFVIPITWQIKKKHFVVIIKHTIVLFVFGLLFVSTPNYNEVREACYCCHIVFIAQGCC
jgi:hypothetical protein